MSKPCEQTQDGDPVDFEDSIKGALYDDTGLAFIVFFRVSNPGGVYSWSEVMAQTPYGEVFVIEHASTKGMFRKRFILTLANLTRMMHFTPTDIFEVSEDSVVRSLVAASGYHIAVARRSGGKDVLRSFWFPLDRGKVGAFRLLAKGPSSTKVKPNTKEFEVPNADQFLKLFNQGVSAFHSGDLQRCIDLLQAALDATACTITNKSAETWLYMGLAYLQLHDQDPTSNRLSNAEGALLTAMTLDHHNHFVISNLGACYIKQERYPEAEQCFLDYVKLKPNAIGFSKLSLICYKTGRIKEAIVYCERVLALDPANADARHNLEGLRRM
jgi:Tfp pilus assembly protein PilF